MGNSIVFTAQSLVQKIRHYLITHLGKMEKEATNKEFYLAFCKAFREEIMINWTANLRTIKENKAKILYYLSMEYLPGKFLGNNIANMNDHDLVKAVLAVTNRSYSDLMACDMDPGLGNGGLGRLASCFLDSLASHQYPTFGYGLRYQYGIFDQELWNGVQVERPDYWLLNENPWEFRKDGNAVSIFFRGRLVPKKNAVNEDVHGLEDYEEVRALPYDTPIVGYCEDPNFSVITMRLWSTKESPHNFELQRFNAGQLDQAAENTTLTDVLYPNDNNETGKRIRLKQEFLLVSASLQDIIKRHLESNNDLNNFADKVALQINDTHPALVIIELPRLLNKEHNIPRKKAWEITQNCCSYTNHTILKEALEEWNEKRVEDLLPRQYYIIQKLNQELCNGVRNKYHDEERVKRVSLFGGGQIRMANLAILGSKKVNGVAELHTHILEKSIFKDFFEMYPNKFLNVTNGVTQRRWLLYCNHRLASFITQRIGPAWITDFSQIQNLANFASDIATQEEFMLIKRKNKEDLTNFLSTHTPIRDFRGKIMRYLPQYPTDALYDVQIKRFHEYKRQLMNALHLIMLYQELKENPSARKIKRIAIIGGKAAPGYEMAKNILKLFFCIARKLETEPEVRKSLDIAIVENYNVSKAEVIIPAADISEQISTAGMEASGTGNMKLTMNGALTLGTEDGANIEMRKAITDKWWPFAFGSLAEELEELRKTNRNVAWEVYINNPKIRKAVDTLKDGSLVKSEAEHVSLLRIYDSLLESHFGSPVDRYFVLKDLPAYYETQKRIEDLYSEPHKWAEYAIHNIAGMGNFSSDKVIEKYAKEIWGLEHCPQNLHILEKVRQDYVEQDRCYIPPTST